MRVDEPEPHRRARTIGRIAFGMREFPGHCLELRLSPKEIELVGVNNKETIYYKRIDSNHSFNNDELLKETLDIIEAGRREGYLPPILNRILLNVGYLPKKINFSRTN